MIININKLSKNEKQLSIESEWLYDKQTVGDELLNIEFVQGLHNDCRATDGVLVQAKMNYRNEIQSAKKNIRQRIFNYRYK